MNFSNVILESLKWFPVVLLWLVYVATFSSYFLGRNFRIFNFRFLAVTGIIFRVITAAALSAGQYYVWSQSELTRTLLNSPISASVPFSDFIRRNFDFIVNGRLGYFLFYVFGRFWLNVFIVIGAAILFYLFLRVLKRHNERFFDEGEVELGFLLAILVGWPNFVAFVPFIFLGVILVSVFRLLYFKEAYTTLGVPMFLAATILMAFGNEIIELLNLGVLKI